MSNIEDALAALKKEQADIGRAIAAVEMIGFTPPKAAPKAPPKPAEEAPKKKRRQPAKVACAVCGTKYVPGPGMAQHVRTRHPDKK